MKRVWGHVLSGVTLSAGLAVASGFVPACVHDDSSIFVSDVLAPQYVTAGMACAFTADPTQPSLGSGTLDASLRAEYSAMFLVGNQLVPRGDPNQPHTETSFVTLQGAVVRIVDSNGNQLNTFTNRAAGTVPPSSGTTPGYLAVGATIIDSATAMNLGLNGAVDPVVSYVRFFGQTLGGESVETNEFGFPVNVCRGCLVSFPRSEMDPSLPQPNCALGGAASSSSSTSVPCVPGQDLPIDCSACAEIPACNPKGTAVPIADAGGGG